MFEHTGGGGAGLGLRTDHVLDQIQSDDVIWRGKERRKKESLWILVDLFFRPIIAFGSATSALAGTLPSVLNVHVRMLDCKALDYIADPTFCVCWFSFCL